MYTSKHLLKRINAKIGNLSFIFLAKLESLLFFPRKKNILFSKHEGLEQNISKGFRFTTHQITFEEFTPENIHSHDLVVPLFIRDLMYLNEVNHLITGNPIPIPNKESIALCEDKLLFNQKLIEKGFADYVPKMGSALDYPFILKKRTDDSSKNCHIISDSDQAEIFQDKITNPEYFCQEIIPGSHEYATHILCKNGEIVHSINIEYVFDKDIPVKGQDKAIYTKICRCPFLDLFSSILATICFNGLCCFNYKVADKHPYILEVNPRFGGSLSPLFFSFIRHLN